MNALQKEKEARPKSQYDLGLRPKLKESNRLKSLSLPHIQTVKPVESAGSSAPSIQLKAFDSPKVPIKYKIDGQINAINKKIEEITLSYGLQKAHVRNIDKRKVII